MLLDEFLPGYHARERHETVVRAPVTHLYRVLRTTDLSASPVVHTLLCLRGLPLLLRRRPSQGEPGQLTLDGFLRSRFILLA